MRFDHKNAIVIGGGTGIGAATARLLHSGGARVVLCGRRASVLNETAGGLDPTDQTVHSSCRRYR